jgi:hypothetical protein
MLPTRLPTKVPVKGWWFRVVLVPITDPHLLDCVGRCVEQEATIYVLNSLPNELRWATLFHEWAHAVGANHSFTIESEDGAEHLASNLLRLFEYLIK